MLRRVAALTCTLLAFAGVAHGAAFYAYPRLGAAPAANDLVQVWDTSAGVLKTVTVADLYRYYPELAALVAGAANLPSAAEKAALQGTNGTPGEANRYVTNSDPRNTDARTPTAHAASHGAGQPDAITPAAIGLGSVDNTSDAAKPISTATQAALDAKVPTTRTIAGKPLSGDVTLVKGDVGLGNVDNTSDAAKPISTATQAALDAKEAAGTAAAEVAAHAVLADPHDGYQQEAEKDQNDGYVGRGPTGDAEVPGLWRGVGVDTTTPDGGRFMKPRNTVAFADTPAEGMIVTGVDPTTGAAASRPWYRDASGWRQVLLDGEGGAGSIDTVVDATDQALSAAAMNGLQPRIATAAITYTLPSTASADNTRQTILNRSGGAILLKPYAFGQTVNGLVAGHQASCAARWIEILGAGTTWYAEGVDTACTDGGSAYAATLQSSGDLAFGSVAVNSTSDLVASWINNGAGPTSALGAATIAGADAAKFSVVGGSDTCSGAVLNPAASCSATVRFAPGATPGGPYSATVGVDGVTATLSGSGVGGGAQSQIRLATGSGVGTNWTSSTGTTVWQDLDDAVGAPDDDASYGWKENTGGYTFFAFSPSFSITPNTITNVRVHFRCREVVGEVNGRGALRVGSSSYYNSQEGELSLTSSYENYYSTWTTNPKHNAACTGSGLGPGGAPDGCCTGAGTGNCAWTETEVEGGGDYPLQQFGAEFRSMDTGETGYCTQVYVELNYQ